jgi:uncharacterized protein
MTSKVWFADARASAKRNRIEKVKLLFERAHLQDLIAPGDRVAVKIHWGEPGNVGFVPPPYVRAIVDLIKEHRGHPFVTDTNTLYTGMRRDALSNLQAAAMNGFTAETLGAPLLVADGLRGRDYRVVKVEGSTVGEAKIAAAILDADALITLSHVKGHMLFGFGGALKNLGMGCATPAGKQVLHSDLRPRVDAGKCCGDALCLRRCPESCIALVDRPASAPGKSTAPAALGAPHSAKVALIDEARCIGCGECTATCPHEAIPINWKTSYKDIMQKTAEYARAAVLDKPGKHGYLNFIIQVTPDCDCCDWNDVAFVPDIGFAAATDPVAIDAASAELVRQAPPVPGSKAAGCTGDPWRAVYDIDYTQIFGFAEALGLGSAAYELVKV